MTAVSQISVVWKSHSGSKSGLGSPQGIYRTDHYQSRTGKNGEKIDNVDQALQRAVDNGVKNLVIQPTHLMHGAEYDELVGELDAYKDKFEKVVVAEPLLGEVGDDATVINDDKKAVAEDITAEAVKTAGYDSLDAAKKDGTALYSWDTVLPILQR